MYKMCVLDSDKECTNCLECEICDLNENIICNNCGKCLNTDNDYNGIIIDEVIED